MKDWTGTRIRAEALVVACRYCHAIIGAPCVTELGKELEAFPAHTMRISDARKASGHPYAEVES